MSGPPDEPGARLERALELFLSHSDSEATDSRALLERHGDLRDLLEPMVANAGGSAEPEERDATAAGERVLGDYRIVRELGRGGMGIVYEAWQRSLDRRVALKVLAPALVASPVSVARFRREAAAAGRLRHPGIVEVYGFGSDGDQHFFAMKLVDGEPLHRVRDRFRTPAAAVALIAQVVDALQHAHASGLVHRDVKPANVLVCDDGTAVLTDFGLAQDALLPSVTREGGFLGTLDYAAPEQVRGEAVDSRADVWAAGVMLHELVAGEHPLASGSHQATMRRILEHDPPDLRRKNPAVSADLAAVLGRAMEKDPARRYPSAAALLADLRALQGGASVAARLSSTGERLVRWARREPWRAILAVVLVVAVPTLSAVVGYLVANAEAIEVGSGELHRRTFEEALARVTIDYEAGDFARSLAHADAALQAQPGNVEATAMRALTQLALGHGRVALEDLDRAAARGADPAAFERARALVLSTLGRQDEARAIEARLGPASRPSELFLTASLQALRARRDGGGREAWQRVVATFSHAMNVSPAPRLHYYVQWIDATRMTGASDAIEAGVRTLELLWPDSPAALLYIGYSMRWQDPARSAAAYRRVLDAGYDHPRIHAILAELSDKLGDPDGARAHRRRALDEYRRRHAAGELNPDLTLNFALLLHEHDAAARPEALEVARQVVTRVPQMPRGHMILGWLLVESGDLPAGAAEYRAAWELRPRDVEIAERLAGALTRLGQHQEAASVLRAWTELAPDNALAHHQLGNALLAADDVPGAVAANERAVACDPERAELRYNLGLALQRAQRLEDARAALAKAIDLRPRYLRAHTLLAGIQAQSGDIRGARATLGKALGLAADDAERATVEAALAELPPGDGR